MLIPNGWRVKGYIPSASCTILLASPLGCLLCAYRVHLTLSYASELICFRMIEHLMYHQ
jgi:hypothetical protein